MPDEVNGQVDVQEETLEPVMPTEEQKPAEEASELPTDVSDRTKEQFEKLKEANARLAAELEARKEAEMANQPKSVLDEITPTVNYGLKPEDQQVDINKFVDADGSVDVDLFNKAVIQAREEAKIAKAEAQRALDEVRRFNQDQQVKQVHSKYDSLVPGSKTFDKSFYEMVRNETYGQMMRGENVDFMKAADRVAGVYKKTEDVEAAKDKAVSEYKEKVQTRDDASIKTGTSQANPGANHDELVRKTRLGDRGALIERLKRSGY